MSVNTTFYKQNLYSMSAKESRSHITSSIAHHGLCSGSATEQAKQQVDLGQLDSARCSEQCSDPPPPSTRLGRAPSPYGSPGAAYCPPPYPDAEYAANYAADAAGYGSYDDKKDGAGFVLRPDLTNYGYSAAASAVAGCGEQQAAAFDHSQQQQQQQRRTPFFQSAAVICPRQESEAGARRPVSAGSVASAGSAASDALEMEQCTPLPAHAEHRVAAPPLPHGYAGYDPYAPYLTGSPAAEAFTAYSAVPHRGHEAGSTRVPAGYDRLPDVYERPAEAYDRAPDVYERSQQMYAFAKPAELVQMAEVERLNNNAPKDYCQYSQPAYTSVIVDAQHYAAQNQYVH